ncbi:unnamed protein product [Phytophthora fragariaefolia]|uniref:Unnamed protein product n=1 Tax=Phytophthora fragariaefolia TaxID=1490495 RepID=A0A9W7D6N9_9STRA|nr:unnamed protein product [Phytophthora fragariaefolia]
MMVPTLDAELLRVDEMIAPYRSGSGSLVDRIAGTARYQCRSDRHLYHLLGTILEPKYNHVGLMAMYPCRSDRYLYLFFGTPPPDRHLYHLPGTSHTRKLFSTHKLGLSRERSANRLLHPSRIPLHHLIASASITLITKLLPRYATLVLRNVVCGICPVPLRAGVGDILLSDAVMERLGYDPYKLIESAQLVQSEYDLGDIGAPDHESGVCAYGVSAGGVTPEEASLSAAEVAACFPVPQVGDPAAAVDQAMSALREGIEDAKAKGVSIDFLDELQTILEEKVDVFRLALGGDPPVDMPPMRIKLKSEATPVRCRARRYSSARRKFLARHVKMLLDAGLCCRNPSSQWCSPPHIVPKGDDHRITVDVREANKHVVPVV